MEGFARKVIAVGENFELSWINCNGGADEEVGLRDLRVLRSLKEHPFIFGVVKVYRLIRQIKLQQELFV